MYDFKERKKLTFYEDKGAMPASCLCMLMDDGDDLDFIKLFG